MKTFCKIAVFALFFAPLLLYNGNGLAENAGDGSPRSAILIEAKTGRVLYERNAHEPLPMASTTKIMTALVALENGDVQDLVTAGKNAFGVPGTSIYLSLGEQLPLLDMLYGLMLASGNDAAVAIAEHIGGDVDGFCKMMNERAADIGCEDTVFATPHGLPADNHHTTASDLALIAREAMQNPTFREIVSTQRASIPWAERDGLELIGAVLNCPNWFQEAAAILDRGFENWQMVSLLSKGETVRTIPVTNGVRASVQVVASDDVSAPVRVDAWPDLLIDLPKTLDAGIKQGQAIGTARLRDAGQTLITVPLVAAESVPERSFRYGWQRLIGAWPLAAGE